MIRPVRFYPVHGNTRFLLFSILKRNSNLFALHCATLAILGLNVNRNGKNANLLGNTYIVNCNTCFGNGNNCGVYFSTADLLLVISGFPPDTSRKFPIR
jgi:hypothetical protein